MANVLNTKATGPASKDTVSGGTKFPIKESQGSVGGGYNLSNTSDEAQRIIMGMRVQSTDYASRDAQAALKGKKNIGLPK